LHTLTCNLPYFCYMLGSLVSLVFKLSILGSFEVEIEILY